MSEPRGEKVWLGLDIGSVSVKGAAVDAGNNILKTVYTRSSGQPVNTTIRVLKELLDAVDGREVGRLGVTGTAGELISSLTGGVFINEIVAQSRTVATLYPHVRTLVEMGGEDSKLLFFKEEEGETVLEDFSMNNLCAAGTGSFLDQQASRMGYSIEGEFGQMALKSKKPPRIAGRCSVFAKSDMIHLQQIGAPDYDIIAGLCYAVARSFKGNVGRGKKFEKPVAFFGGVASNAGVVAALADELEIGLDELFIPPEKAVTGAIGSALASREEVGEFEFRGVEGLSNYQAARDAARAVMKPLTGEKNDESYTTHTRRLNGGPEKTPCYIGIDIGSLSTNVVAVDKDLNVLARRYLRTQSRPIQAVTRGLKEIGDEIGGRVEVLGVGTTGSGRYMIGDFVGADVVRNEITAQATAAIHFVPGVDTIFEIGGQDSKYISVENGAVVDFEMNKVCAAGTGSFIEEQAEKIDLNIEKEFSDTAFRSGAPGKFGDRCTVFMESDLVSNQQKGMSKEDLAAGLAYSIVSNYINRVVGHRRIGQRILFQGGVAWNKAVVSAFEAITGKKVEVPPHHDVTGAIGAAMIARKHHEKSGFRAPTAFKGFDLTRRKYKVTTFECKACENVCDVSRVKFDGEASYYGARCELFEKGAKKKKSEKETLPDLFAERERMIFGDYLDRKKPGRDGRPVVGVPRALFGYELFPFWSALLEELGVEVILSGRTSQRVIRDSIEKVKAETCFPVKIVHGHVADLVDKGVDYIFLPSIITANEKGTKFRQSHTCPMVQSIPFVIKAAMDVGRSGAKLLEPAVHFQRGDDFVARELADMFKKEFGTPFRKVKTAVKKARAAQNRFYAGLKKRGREVMDEVKAKGGRPVVIISRPYNGCDSGINLDLPRKLKEMGKVAVPMDCLELSEDSVIRTNPDMYWRSGQRMLAAADVIREDSGLDAIFISNFKCGPDSFIQYHLREKLGGKPVLSLELDEHSADAGAVTRLEAFFDSLENVDTVKFAKKKLSAEAAVARSGAGANGNGAKTRAAGTNGRNGRNGRNGKSGYGRVLYLPYMCDHGYILAAALRKSGIAAEALPVSDQESLDIGLRFSSGKECIPYAITTGDIVKKTREKGFDPDGSAFFMPTTSGPCRFGQYQSTQRLALDSLGLSKVPLLSPDGDKGYDESKELGLSVSFRRDTWRGVVVVDILQKLLHETRPYEVNKGETESVYQELLDETARIVERGSAGLFEFVNVIRDRFRAIPVEKVRRPVIGVLGEIYMRSHRFGNRDIIRRIEDLGGEAWLSPIGEWILYCTDRYIANSWKDKKYLDLFKGYMQDRIQKKEERRLYEPFRDTLVNGEDAATSEILKNASPYMSDAFEGEAILSVGKAVEFAERGLSGVVNIMPFTCMPGTIVAAISKKVREDYNNIPWLNLDYDGVEDTGSQVRLEAFMYQASQYGAQVKESVV
ncbi:MAG: acyl-CoA dehydratase activase [Candidatus Nitrospinota bacterium M3_3B_026]